MRVQPECSHPQLTHHTVLSMAVLQNLPGSTWFRETGSRGSTIALAPRSSSQLALLLPSTSSPAILCTVPGRLQPLSLVSLFHLHSLSCHDKEMRNHSLCYASAVPFVSGHCTSKGTQCSVHPACITASQELYISMVSIFKVSLMCPDPAFSRTKHALSAQFS